MQGKTHPLPFVLNDSDIFIHQRGGRNEKKTIITIITKYNKKLSYCWETVRRESMPRIAEMDVEMTT